MANIVVTTTTGSILVDFGVYSTPLGMSKGVWRKDTLININLRTDGVLVDIEGQSDWLVSFDGKVGTFQIDSIDGVAPTSDSDLFDKLKALLG
jgi:hypothetical protein